MTAAFNRLADLLRDRGEPTLWRGGQMRTRGLCHDGDAPDTVGFTRGRDGGVVICCHKCGDTAAFLAAIGWTELDLFDESASSRTPATADDWLPCTRHGHTKVAEYVYRDQRGLVVHGVTRCDRKCFAQWRPAPESRSGRRWSLNDAEGYRTVPVAPYRLPELLAAKRGERVVWIVEGEKDADALAHLGLPATCNAGGAGKWTAEHARWLAGADVTVVADRDEKGREHAEQVVETLVGLARSVEVVQARAGKDASDHLAAGLGYWQFVPAWEPVPFPVDELEAVLA